MELSCVLYNRYVLETCFEIRVMNFMVIFGTKVEINVLEKRFRPIKQLLCGRNSNFFLNLSETGN